MRISILSFVGCLFLTFVSSSSARPVKWWSPEELAERSEVIIVGQAIDIKPTGKKGSIRLGGTNPEVPVLFYRATVQVNATVWGEKVEGTIEVEFSQVDFEKGGRIVNGPGRFALSKGQIYILYLKQGRGESYVGALFGEYDDNQAAVVIAPVK